MPILKVLKLEQFRNFKHFELEFAPGLNYIVGANGSGKTSILEAIHFLAYGKSFRSKELNRMIHQGDKSFTLFTAGTEGETPFKIGLKRSGPESTNRLNGEHVKTLSEFAEVLPLLLIHPESFQLLTGGAKLRRQLIDWGVFYHYQAARTHFAMIRKCLRQRNQSLKQHASREQARLWETTCYEACEALNQLRQQYVTLLAKQTQLLLGNFVETHHLNFEYAQGWPEGETLSEAWERSFLQDLRSGHTEYGPHQADLKITSHKKPTRDVLSRGQQKTLVCTLKLAQGLLFEDLTQCKPLYLFDDLASELDKTHRQKLIHTILEQNCQVILTGIEKDRLFKAQHFVML